jgi:hypothetical protein
VRRPMPYLYLVGYGLLNLSSGSWKSNDISLYNIIQMGINNIEYLTLKINII